MQTMICEYCDKEMVGDMVRINKTKLCLIEPKIIWSISIHCTTYEKVNGDQYDLEREESKTHGCQLYR